MKDLFPDFEDPFPEKTFSQFFEQKLWNKYYNFDSLVSEIKEKASMNISFQYYKPFLNRETSSTPVIFNDSNALNIYSHTFNIESNILNIYKNQSPTNVKGVYYSPTKQIYQIFYEKIPDETTGCFMKEKKLNNQEFIVRDFAPQSFFDDQINNLLKRKKITTQLYDDPKFVHFVKVLIKQFAKEPNLCDSMLIFRKNDNVIKKILSMLSNNLHLFNMLFCSRNSSACKIVEDEIFRVQFQKSYCSETNYSFVASSADYIFTIFPEFRKEFRSLKTKMDEFLKDKFESTSLAKKRKMEDSSSTAITFIKNSTLLYYLIICNDNFLGFREKDPFFFEVLSSLLWKTLKYKSPKVRFSESLEVENINLKCKIYEGKLKEQSNEMKSLLLEWYKNIPLNLDPNVISLLKQWRNILPSTLKWNNLFILIFLWPLSSSKLQMQNFPCQNYSSKL